MQYRTGSEVRQLFLDYFKAHGHMIEPGASLVPVNDPTLLWINSGVAALKKYFDGSVKPASPRIVNAQKSIRTNDIDNVGKTARHHTFFEMLGNFSIGDYFKSEALAFAWEFLTSPKYIGMEIQKVYVSVHPDDTEAYRIWVEEIKIDPTHILKSEANYWQIGEGPCGPNSEIYYDRGETYDLNHVGERLFFEELENDRYIEVWNVVFSQYDGKEGVARNLYKELPQRNIDTGMGLERLVCIVQEVETNFDTDLFMPVILAVQKKAKHPYADQYKMAYRVIADHIRTVTFALADGALFSNEGRGYVLRRLLRRAVRYGIKLGIDEPFMYDLVKVVSDMMQAYYGYISKQNDLISRLIKAEEQRFHQTLNDGEVLLLNTLKESKDQRLEGKVVFKLYDTFGFPMELTKEIAEEKGYTIDEIGFKAEMEKQRERARRARENTESMGSQSVDLMNFTLESKFVGYDTFKTKSKVIALFKDGKIVDRLDDEGDMVLDLTPFYAESGGQIADTGNILFKQGEAMVKDVIKAPHKQSLHHIVLIDGILKLNDSVECSIDLARRKRITANHSAAHLLQASLKKVVGDHIHQAGSYIDELYFRFDFTHYEKVSEASLKAIELEVNQFIYQGAPVLTEVKDIEDAKQSGALALFSEKYDKLVRVVSMQDISKELCGGCHVSNTSEIGLFKIVSEESIGSGIRRITASTQLQAYTEFLLYKQQLENIALLYKANTILNIEERVKLSHQEINTLRQDLSQARTQMASLAAKGLALECVSYQDFKVLIKHVDMDFEFSKLVLEQLNQRVPDALIILASSNPEACQFVITCGPSAIKAGFKAGDLAKTVAVICNGNGGGRPDFAQSGGKDSSKVDEALDVIRKKMV